MSKSDPAAMKKERNKTIRWVVTIFFVTVLVSSTISVLSDYIMRISGMAVAFLIQGVSPEELLDAKANPENHKNLIVRVGGYSDYFTSLTPELQDNVIERTLNDI